VDDKPQLQQRLLVTTSWGAFGSLGLAFVASGFGRADLFAGLLGFSLIVAAYVSHIIINRICGTGFRPGEVALGFTAFAAFVSSFALSWIALPSFPATNVAIGLSGCAAIVAVFIFYMVSVHGVRGSIALIDKARRP
jgi:hypothetical protein